MGPGVKHLCVCFTCLACAAALNTHVHMQVCGANNYCRAVCNSATFLRRSAVCAACRLYRIFMFLINVRALCRCHCSFACQGHALAAVSSIGPGTTATQKARPSSEAQHTQSAVLQAAVFAASKACELALELIVFRSMLGQYGRSLQQQYAIDPA